MKAYNLETAARYREEVTELYLHRCGLPEVPSLVYDCPELRCFEFSNNGLAEAPPDLQRLPGLEQLSLAGNRLRELPDGLARLTKLRRLDLSHNAIEELPAWVARLPRLEVLLLSGNRLTSLPPELGQCSRLRRLDVSENKISRLPAALGGLPALRILQLNGNRLRTLPAALRGLSQLERLELSGNRLKALPGALCRGWPQLSYLRLSENRLSDLPDELAACSMLAHLDGSRNRLAALPAAIGQLSWLRQLHLHGNKLRQLPAALGEAGMLRELDLSNNELETLPASLVQLARLTRLDLSRNRLTALPPLPPHLTQLRLAHNGLGAWPATLLHLTSLERLDLSNNRLVAWPAALSGLSALRELTLRGNELPPLPGPLLQLPQLEKLKGAGTPGARKHLLQLLRANRKSPVPEPLLLAFFELVQGKPRLSELSLPELGQGLYFSLKTVRLAVREHLVRERGAGLKLHPLRAGARVGLVGKTHFDEEQLRVYLAGSGISFLPRREYRAATHLVLGDRPPAAPDLRPGQVFLSEPDLNAFLDCSGDRYLVRESSSEQLDRLQHLLLHQETHNVRLAVQLLQGGGVPQDLLTDLFVAWKRAPRGRLRRDLRRLLELNLPESDRWVLSLRIGLSNTLTWEARERNIRRFTEGTVLDEGRLRAALALEAGRGGQI